MEGFRDNAAMWMVLFFVGVLYWAFGARFRRRDRDRNDVE